MLASSAGWLRAFHNRGLRRLFFSALGIVLVWQWFSSQQPLHETTRDVPYLDQVFHGQGKGGRKSITRPPSRRFRVSNHAYLFF